MTVQNPIELDAAGMLINLDAIPSGVIGIRLDGREIWLDAAEVLRMVELLRKLLREGDDE